MPFQAVIGEPTPKCPVSELHFDATNPRLVTGDSYSTSSDEDIISTLHEIASLDELLSSICANNYLDLEPLIVMGNDGGPYRVLEGNRRLAAIKLLRDADLARRCKISVPKNIPAAVLASIEQVTIWRVQKEADARAFIGFKHINGPHRWDAYAKARFVADWYKRDKDKGVSIDSIARQIGDDNDTIRSYISAILVVEQAERQKLFSITNRHNKGRFAFSHLYTALNRSEYQDFLGLESGWTKEPSENPVPSKNQDKLEETLLYLYGSKEDNIPPLVRSQNPDLKQVGECLTHPVALLKLRDGESLAVAYNEVRSPYEVFSEALAQAHVRMKQALEALPKYEGDEALVKIADEIVTMGDIIVTTMKKKANKS